MRQVPACASICLFLSALPHPPNFSLPELDGRSVETGMEINIISFPSFQRSFHISSICLTFFKHPGRTHPLNGLFPVSSVCCNITEVFTQQQASHFGCWEVWLWLRSNCNVLVSLFTLDVHGYKWLEENYLSHCPLMLLSQEIVQGPC
jgi:hypothetical protein